jgi:hypothetical protein
MRPARPGTVCSVGRDVIVGIDDRLEAYAVPTQIEVDIAEQRLLEVVEEQEAWAPKALRQRARDGLPFETISLAFWRLLNRGALVLDDDRRVRRARNGN